jgi:tankyrase
VKRLLGAFPHIVNCRDLDGRHSTPLHFAAGYNRVSVVEFLLAHGADVHSKDKGYVKTLLYHVLSKYCRLSIKKPLLQKKKKIELSSYQFDVGKVMFYC